MSDPDVTGKSPTPIVGIGASAGGLEALSELFSSLPADGGAAFLVVQHLDPTRPSLLPSILSSQTNMPVVEAGDGMQVEPDRVYVIPPNARMLVVNGRIQLQPRDSYAGAGAPTPVDDLYYSMAEDQGANAIGVVLSGGGSDGALGVQAIQREGGLTFAQDEASAKFGSMPGAAIDTGSVDFILPPREIAAEIRRIASQTRASADGSGAGSKAAAAQDTEAQRGMRHILWLLQNACDIDFTHYKRGTMERRLSRRMALRQVETLKDYIGVLEADPAETLALGRDLLIRVTEFFRDPETFETLAETVFPRILREHEDGQPVRIWVPGCASGEEVYSLAICLAEYLGARLADTPVQIFGTDISVDALEAARAGRYLENIVRTVSPERLNRFFTRDGHCYRVDKSIRDLCTFARQNVAHDPPFSRMDLVSCRNLLIYLDPVLQRHVLPLFHYALRPEGVLMLGPSETVGALSEYFGVLEGARSKVYLRKPRPDRSRGLAAGSFSTPRAPRRDASPIGSDAPSEGQLRAEADRKTLSRYAPPAVLCDDELNILEFRGDNSAWLVHREGPPSSNLMQIARPEVFLAVSEAVKQVRLSGVTVRRSGLRVPMEGGVLADAIVEVHPLQVAGDPVRFFLIFFEGPQQPAAAQRSAGRPFSSLLLHVLQQRVGRLAARSRDEKDAESERLGAELDATRDRLRAVLEEHESAREELKSSEEELLSSNEEFRSTNEELETAKEELQSINEELSTTNEELRYRLRELKDLHADVARARDYADAIIETTTEPMLVLDGELRVHRGNAAFCRMFSMTSEGIMGKRLYALGDGQWDIPALRELLETILPQQTVVRDYEFSVAFSGIGPRTFRVNARRLEWTGRALILLTVEDISQQQADMDKLRDADRQKDEFLAMLGHELRNPLAAIRSGLHVWQRGTADSQTVLATQNAMRRQLHQEISLVDDLLDVSRITRGMLSLNTANVDLAEAATHAAAALRAASEARGHHLTVSLPDRPLVVLGDSLRLEQIANNLLGNAIKYTTDGGVIHLTVERDREDAVLSVTDTGIGIRKESLASIFDIFVQADQSADHRASGLGLGLALVRKLVELHGGSVVAASDGPNAGSRFVVRLPALPDGAQATASEGMDTVATSVAPPRRILVVDDNRDAGDSIAALLRLDGHEVQIARDGSSALARVDRFHPDVVLLDIGLPDMDGHEVARRIRANPEFSNVLLVALSGYGTPGLSLSEHKPFDHYLVKPASLTQLNALIATGAKRA